MPLIIVHRVACPRHEHNSCHLCSTRKGPRSVRRLPKYPGKPWSRSFQVIRSSTRGLHRSLFFVEAKWPMTNVPLRSHLAHFAPRAFSPGPELRPVLSFRHTHSGHQPPLSHEPEARTTLEAWTLESTASVRRLLVGSGWVQDGLCLRSVLQSPPVYFSPCFP